MIKIVKKAGFTLIEVLVALTISGFLMTILITAFFDTYVFSQEMAVRAALLEDSKILMDTIAREISEGSVDYEEYFNQCVVNGLCPNVDISASVTTSSEYGQDHGLYAWQFYDGGIYYSAGKEVPDAAGALCQKPNGSGGYDLVRVPDPDCVSASLSYSEDFNEGIFGGTSSAAFCSSSYLDLSYDTGNSPNPAVGRAGNGSCSSGVSNVFDELYIISEDESVKTIYSREQVSDNGYAVSKLELIADAATTSGGIETKDYICAEGYNCTNSLGEMVDRTDLYSLEDGEDILENFIPVTPLKVSVEELKFVIEPREDASKAFGEFDPNVQVPPRVTILMTLKTSPDYFVFGLSDEYELKIQRTVVASVD